MSLTSSFLFHMSHFTSTEEARGLKQSLDRSYCGYVGRRTLQDKSNIFVLDDLPEWVIKTPRPCEGTTADSHLYRLRKADKLRRICLSHGFDREVAIPRKYLYKNYRDEFVVVAQKLELNQHPVRVAQEIGEQIAREDSWGFQPLFVIVARALKEDAISLTSRQCHILATLVFSKAQFTDVSFGNLFLTEDGKLALIDTEPVKRHWKKTMLKPWIPFLPFMDRGHAVFKQAMIATCKLKIFAATSSEAKKAIVKVENKNIAIWAVKSVVKVALAVFAVYATVHFIPVGIFLLTVAKVVAVSLASLKTLMLSLETIGGINVIRLNKKGDVASLGGLEIKGMI